MFESGVRLIALVPLGFLVRLFRTRSASWYSPAALFAITWFLAIALPLLFAPDYDVWVPAVWLLVAFVAVFGISAMAMDRGTPPAAIRPQAFFAPSRAALRYTTLALSFVGVISVQVLLREYGKNLIDLATLDTWIELGASFSVARYAEDYVQPVTARLCSIGFYCGSLFGAVLYWRARTRLDRLISFVPLVVALAYAAILTTRAVFLFAVLMWISCAVAIAIAEGRPLRKLLKPRTVVIALVLPPVVLAFFVALQLSRGGKTDLSSLPETVDHLRVWFFGHLPGFTAWLRIQIGDGTPLRLGQRTFGGLFQLGGVARREQGVYGDVINVGNGDLSNIYTVFRSLIEDFGMAGTLIFLAVLGLAAGHFHARLVRDGFKRVPAYALILCFIGWSPIYSFWAYNTLLVAFVLFAAGLKLLTPKPFRPVEPAGVSAVPIRS